MSKKDTPYTAMKKPASLLFGEPQPNTTLQDTDSQISNQIAIEQIKLPPSQPRRYFDPQTIQSLAESIKQDGLLEPIVVRKAEENTYELVAGERRLKACEIAGLNLISIRIIDCDEKTAIRIRLVENLQREDLNAFEETIGILELIATELEIDSDTVVLLLYQMNNDAKGLSNNNVMVSDESQAIQAIFSNLGKITWQSFVANRLPLLKLPEDIQNALSKGKLEYTKARAISTVKDSEQRADLLEKAVEQNLSLSKIKELIKQLQSVSAETVSSPREIFSTRITDISKRLVQAKVWEDIKKRKRVEKLLSDLEKLLDAPDTDD